jgi:hypothetical protein
MIKRMKNLKVEYYEDALITHHNLSVKKKKNWKNIETGKYWQIVATATFAQE